MVSGHRMGIRAALLFCLAVADAPLGGATAAPATPGGNYSELVFPGPDGKLQYKPDEHGNTIPDFSNCGYGGGGAAIPDVPAKSTLAPLADSKDDTQRIQKAIDEVSKLPPGAAGNGKFRGVVLLKRGTYRVGGQNQDRDQRRLVARRKRRHGPHPSGRRRYGRADASSRSPGGGGPKGREK